MLAYAADAPRFFERRSSPSTLLLIVGVHALALGVLLTARMDVGARTDFTRTIVDLIKVPPPPNPIEPPPQPRNPAKPQPSPSVIDQVKPVVPIEQLGPVFPDPPLKLPPGPVAGNGTEVVPNEPVHQPVRVAARFNTPEWALRPPYPDSKRQLEQEATLKLRLSIDDRGRVVAVEPVGKADPIFLAAARKHLIARWRYKPATEDGRPVHSSTVVTLRFELEA